VRNVLADVGADPAEAREWRGSILLTFAEVPESHPYLNPSIVDFLKNLYAEFPHLLYFLNPDPASGATDGFFASIGALGETEDGAWIIVDFKTDADAGPRREQYERQLQWYAHALTTLTGMPARAHLLSL